MKTAGLFTHIEIRIIKYGSAEYEKELSLRDKILRKPLNMSIYDDDIEAEKNDLHIGAYFKRKLVGALILSRIDDEQIKMRQVAVSEELRRQGIGRRMVHFAEQEAAKLGYMKIVLNARKTAVPFYQKLGYQVTGEEFIEISIPHKRMFIEF